MEFKNVNTLICGMESTSVKIEPIHNEIKKEPDCDNHYTYNEQSQDDIDIKLEFNYSLDAECKKNFGAKCDCIRCICKVEAVDQITDNCFYLERDKVKLEENDNKALLNDNLISISNSDLGPTDCYDNDKQKINISKATLKFDSGSSMVQPYLGSEIKIEYINPETGQVVQLKQPLTTLSSSKKHFNDDIGDLTTNSAVAVGDSYSAAAKPHVCPSCQKSFTKKRSLFSHILANHSDDQHSLKAITWKIHSCPTCNKQFIGETSLSGHIRRDHNGENLLKHVSRKVYDCSKCDKQFLKKYNFERHILYNHADDESLLDFISCRILTCPKCPKRFINARDLDGHLLNQHENEKDLSKMITKKTYDCPTCNKRFARKRRLDDHIMKIHDNDESLLKTISSKSYHCPTCSKRFLFQRDLDNHILMHHRNDKDSFEMISSRLLICPKCNKQFTIKSSLIRHIVSVHRNDESALKRKPGDFYTCPRCRRRFKNKSRFFSHIMHRHKDDVKLLEMVSREKHTGHKCNKQFTSVLGVRYTYSKLSQKRKEIIANAL